MSYRVILRNRQTGDAVIRTFDGIWHGEFCWKEGNFSCDCNRWDFMYRWFPEDEIDDDTDCGTSLIAVDAIYGDDGVLLYKEKK